MVGDVDNFLTTLSRARDGASDAAGELLEAYRNYLRMLAAAQIRESIGKRVSPSDVVQDTMLAAHQNIASFRGNSSPEFSAWLRTILTRCLIRAIDRNTKIAKRDVRREISFAQLQRAVDSSTVCAFSLLKSSSQTPSQIVSREEDAVHVANLLSQLPEDYQQVISLRNFGNLRFEEVASQMNRSETAVRLLWLRAVRRLRELYQKAESTSC